MNYAYAAIGMKKALIIVDMVNDFVTGKLKCERAQKIIPNIRKLAEAAREKGALVVYVNDAHLPSDHELSVWGPHSMKGTEGAEVIGELKPKKGDFVLEKRTYSAFYETGLEPLLRDNGVEAIIIAGLHTHICDRHTSADAFFRGYGIIVPEDASESFTEEDHRRGLDYLRTMYKAETPKTAELVKKL